MHDSRICPDLDTIMYTLGAGRDPVRAPGREDKSWRVMKESSTAPHQCPLRECGVHVFPA
jgi:hypothetical protein